MLALGGVHDALPGDSVQFAVVENRLAVTEDEIDIPGNVAVFEVLPRRQAWAIIAVTILARGEESILRSEQAKIRKGRTVSGYSKGDRLPLAAAGVVRDRQMIDGNIRSFHKDGSAIESASRLRRSIIKDDRGLSPIDRFPMQVNMRLADGDDLAIDAGFDGNIATGKWQRVDRLLNGAKVPASILRNDQS